MHNSGVMEMKRLNPEQPWFARLALNAYRWASGYGGDYKRAFYVLLGIVFVATPLLFTLPIFELNEMPTWSWDCMSIFERILIGLTHSFEIATLQRNRRYTTGNDLAQLAAGFETLLVAGQAALFLLALRRRMKR